MTGSCGGEGGGWEWGGVPMHGKGVSAYRNGTIAHVRKEDTVREGTGASASGKGAISCWKREGGMWEGGTVHLERGHGACGKGARFMWKGDTVSAGRGKGHVGRGHSANWKMDGACGKGAQCIMEVGEVPVGKDSSACKISAMWKLHYIVLDGGRGTQLQELGSVY